MISKNMYKVLKILPHAPCTMTFEELHNICKITTCRLIELLEEAEKHSYLEIVFLDDEKIVINSDLYLMEAGQTAIEKYKKQKGDSAKATWALIIAGLSFIASVVAIVISMIYGVQ